MTVQYPPSRPNRTEVGQPQTGSLDSHDHESFALLLKQTRPWVLVIAVLLAIGAGLTLSRSFTFGLASLFPDSYGEVVATTIAVRFLALGSVYAVLAAMLFRYSGHVTRYIETPTVGYLSEAIKAQKSIWRFSGIAGLSLIALYLILRMVTSGVIPSQGL